MFIMTSGGDDAGYIASGETEGAAYAALRSVALDGIKSVSIEFSGSANTSLAELHIDSPDGAVICVAALSSMGERDTARQDIAAMSGTHDIYIIIDGGAKLCGVSFCMAGAYEQIAYVPTDE
ncbi:MAG: hypothetical protein WCQ72_04820, partial [Eubacteriales bacterium]